MDTQYEPRRWTFVVMFMVLTAILVAAILFGMSAAPILLGGTTAEAAML